MRVAIDSQRCSGHGRCYVLAPTIFSADEQGWGESKSTELTASEEEEARRAVANCPEQAISIIE